MVYPLYLFMYISALMKKAKTQNIIEEITGTNTGLLQITILLTSFFSLH